MQVKNTMSLSEARKRIFELAEEAQAPHNIFTFTEHGKPKVVMMSAEEFESWQETIAVMREVPDLHKRASAAAKLKLNKNSFTLEKLRKKWKL